MSWMVLGDILLATALGSLVGLEREVEAQRAGLRTHMLVALGAAAFTAAGAHFVHDSNPTRIAAQVVSGIGFLGAGAILRAGLNIHGLTTAATLWVTAAIGVAGGLGNWQIAIASTALSLLALELVKRAERGIALSRPTVVVTLDLAAGVSPSTVCARIEQELPGTRILEVSSGATGSTLQLLVRQPGKLTLPALNEQLLRIDGTTSVTVGG